MQIKIPTYILEIIAIEKAAPLWRPSDVLIIRVYSKRSAVLLIFYFI